MLHVQRQENNEIVMFIGYMVTDFDLDSWPKYRLFVRNLTARLDEEGLYVARADLLLNLVKAA